MTCAFLGGSAGSWAGVRAYTAFGWTGVCTLVALLSGLALLRHTLRDRPTTPATKRLVLAEGQPASKSAGTDGLPPTRLHR